MTCKTGKLPVTQADGTQRFFKHLGNACQASLEMLIV